MRLFFLFSLLATLVIAQDISFINPESQPGAEKNFALNPSYVIGSSLLIQWTKTNENISLVMYQERPGDQFEYVFQNSFGISSFRWNVGTQKNLANGRVFFFQIFITGETGPTATSRYFNLTRDRTDDDATTTSLSASIATPTPTTVPSSTTSTGTGTPTDPPASNDGGGLGTGAKVGLGVGIPIAVIIGLAAGWFFFGRKRNKNDSQDYTNTGAPYSDQENKYTHPGDGNYPANAMGEQGGGYYKPQGSSNLPPSEIYTPPSRPSELPSQRYE